jgi:hypothetical protein
VDPEVFSRLRFRPGEEAQIDFGDVGRVLEDGRLRKVYLFAMTLCYSRYTYFELVLDQTVPTFLGCIRRGFEYFCGVPERLKLDNLRSGVLIDRLGERCYQDDFFRFCRHYGTVPDAARIRRPTDKARVERNIGYAKTSFFNGRDLAGLEETRKDLAAWREEVANVRIHGTTRRRPSELFEIEREHLKPLPAEAYEVCHLGRYRVRKDCHIHVHGNFYSVPHAYVGRRVLVRLSERKVAIFSDEEQLAEHERAEGKGQDVTDPSHYPPTKRLSNQEIRRRRVMAIRAAGPHAARFLSLVKQGRSVFGDQLIRLAGLVASHGEEEVEAACRRALFFGATQSSVTVERILARGLQRQPLPDDPGGAARNEDRDFGRPLSEYGALLAGRAVTA